MARRYGWMAVMALGAGALGCEARHLGASSIDDEDAGTSDGEAPSTVDTGSDATDPAAYWRDEMAARGSRPSTGAGRMTDAGCATDGWVPTSSGCAQPCLTQSGLDGGNDGGSALYIPDNELCITNQCPPPFARLDVTMRVGSGFAGVLYVPFHCDGGAVTCDCLPPDVCGTGHCTTVEANAVVCACEPDP